MGANAAQNGVYEIQRIPEVFSTDLPLVHIYNLPQKIISMASSAVLIEPSSSAVYSNHQLHFADGIQTINRLPEVVESATGQPLFVNIQPSQMANVVIPHGSSSALIYGGVQEVHKSGETFDDPLPYPNDDQATFSIGHQSKSPIISAPTVQVQPAVLAAVLHSNYDSPPSSNDNQHFVKAPISSNQKVNFDSHVLSQDIDMHVPPIIFRNQDSPASIAATSSAEYYPNDIQIIHGDFGQLPNRPDAPSPSPATDASSETNQFYSHQIHRPIHGNFVRAQSPFNVDIESINFGMSNDASSAGLSTPSSTSSASIEQNEDDDRNPIEDHHKDDDYENEQGEVIQESNAVPQLIASEQATSLSIDANLNRIPSYAKPTTKTTEKGHRAPFTQTEANSLWENGDAGDAISNQRITEHYSTSTTTTTTTTTTDTTTTTPFVMPSSQQPQQNRNRPPVVVRLPQVPPGMINEMYTALRYRNQTTPPAMNAPNANHGHIRKPFYSQLPNERPPKQNLYANTLVPLQHLRPPPQFASALAFDRRRPPQVNLANNNKHTTKQQPIDAGKVHLSTANYVSTHRPIFTGAGSQFSISTTAATTTVTTPRPPSQPTAPNLFDPTRGKPFRAMPSQSSAALNLNTGEIRLPEQPVTVATTTTTTSDTPTVHPFNAQANDSVRNDANEIATNNDFDAYHSHLNVPLSRSPSPTSNYPNELAVEMRPPPPVAVPSKYKPFVPKLHVVPPPHFASAPPFDRRRRPQQSAAGIVSTSPPTSTNNQNVEEVLGMQPPPPPTQMKRKQKPKIEMHKVIPEHVNELNISPPRFIRPTQTLATASAPLHPSSSGKSKLTSNYVTIDMANEPAPTSSVEIVPIDQSLSNVDTEQQNNASPSELTTHAPPTTTAHSDPEETESQDEYVHFSIGGRHHDSLLTPVKSDGDDIIIMGSEHSSFDHSEVVHPSQSSSTASFSHEPAFVASVEQIPHSIHIGTSSSSRHSDTLPSTRTISTMIFNTFEPTATLSTTTAATDPLPTKYITNTKTLTVTTTKTTVIRSAGITTTLTLTLTKTQTETIVDTITHTLLQPTRIGHDPVIKPTIFTAPITMKTRMQGGSLTSVVPNPSFSIYANLDDRDHNDSEEIKSIEMDDDVEERRENNRVLSTVSSRMRIRPTTARPMPNATNESIFVVMTDRKKLGLIKLNSSDVLDAALNKAKSEEHVLSSDNDSNDDDNNHPNRDEDDVTNDVSHVLLGGILIATPPRSEVSKGKGAPTTKQQKNNHYDIDLNAELGEHLDDNVAAAAGDNVIDESKHDLQRIMAIDECMPECKAINNEWCQNIDGVARCVCRVHFARMFADHPCQREYIPPICFSPFHFLTSSPLHQQQPTPTHCVWPFRTWKVNRCTTTTYCRIRHRRNTRT